MAIISDGAKKMSAEAASEPARGPRSADHGRTALATSGTRTVSTPDRAMMGAKVRVAPRRSAICPPSQ
jgi:hypothetical protein